MPRIAHIVQFSDLPAAAQQRGRGQGAQNFGKSVRDLAVSDLSPSQRTQINNNGADVVVIKDGRNHIILGTTGDFSSAVRAIIAAS